MSYNDRFTYIHSGQFGTPQMTGNEYKMNDVLDMALVNGGVEVIAERIEIVNPREVKIYFEGGHTFASKQLVTVVGADDTNLNGTHRIKNIGALYILLKTTNNIVANTGNIKVKITPLGFESLFGDTNPDTRAYRSKNMDGTRTVLYVRKADTSSGYSTITSRQPQIACVSMCHDMKTIDTPIADYTAEVNSGTDSGNGNNFWYQARFSSKTGTVDDDIENKWVIFGNGDYFYFFNNWCRSSSIINSGNPCRDLYGFGDIIPIGKDEYNCVLMCTYSENDSATSIYVSNGGDTGYPESNLPVLPVSGKFNMYYIKSLDGNSNAQVSCITPSGYSNGFRTGRTPAINYPNTSSNSLVAVSLYTYTSSNDMRGIMPRLMAIPQNLAGLSIPSTDLKVIDDEILLVGVQSYNTSSSFIGYYALDITDE